MQYLTPVAQQQKHPSQSAGNQGTRTADKEKSSSSIDRPHSHPRFFVFGADRNIYGPVSLNGLKDWVSQALVRDDTWVYQADQDIWRKACHISQLGVVPSVDQALVKISLTASQLKRIPLFADMSPADLEHLRPYLSESNYPPMRSVICRGSPGGILFILFRGEAIVSYLDSGARKVVSTLKEGDLFGENTVLEKCLYRYSLDTTQECRFVCISFENFQRLMQREPEVSSKLLGALVRRMSYSLFSERDRNESSQSISKTFSVPASKRASAVFIRKRKQFMEE
jgi:CRP-like cAMP-binding protein